jgi:hypothetical protein
MTFAASRSEAMCTPRDPDDINNPKEYLSALLVAAVVFKTAVHRSIEFGQTTTAMDGMAVFENARQEYFCAASYVDPYAKSANEAVSTSAQSFVIAASKLHDISEAERQHLKDLLDGKTEKPSEQAERAGQLEVQGQDAWHFESNAVLVACMALVEFGPDNKQAGLVLTKAERGAFIARIRKAFGNPSSNATVPPLDSSMILLRDILADEKTRPSHVPT